MKHSRNMIQRYAAYGVAAAIVLFAVITLLYGGRAEAAMYTVTCTPPTARADGTPYNPTADGAKYTFYDKGAKTGGPTTECSFFMNNWPAGTYDIEATTTDSRGVESVLSSSPDIVLVDVEPAVPRNVQIVGNTVTCDPPTKTADGSTAKIPALRRFQLYLNGELESQSETCSFTLARPDGTYNVQVQAVDVGGLASALTPGKTYTSVLAAPNPPTELR